MKHINLIHRGRHLGGHRSGLRSLGPPDLRPDLTCVFSGTPDLRPDLTWGCPETPDLQVSFHVQVSGEDPCAASYHKA